ncbi:MAG: TolC family outer membrane protein [Betaproteobacteria bacterium]|nr:TolC family outer membrane protein [Betaproteobacteria bacterium]MCC7218738.1 TolC family outer membrane protein [Burkholderiales bacterium]
MTMRRTLLAAAGAVAFALAAAPAIADVDLVAAWEAAQRQDPALAAARAEQDAGQARTRQARALSLPTVTVSGSVGYGKATQNMSGAQFNAPAFGSFDGVDFRTEVNDGTTTGWKISAEQPLYNQERRASARQLEIQADRGNVAFRAARQDLMLRTARAYFDVLQAEDALEEVRRQQAATARALEVTQASYDEGKLPITDRNEAQARYDGIVARESAARDAVELARAAFFELTGIADAPLRRIPATSPLAAFDAGKVDPWLAKAAAQNPAIALSSLGRDIAAQEVRKWDAQAAPTVSLVAQAGGDRISGNSGFGGTAIASSNSGVVGLQVAIPLYTGGMRGARGDEAIALAEKARLEVEAARKAASLQTRGAWLGATGGLTRVAAHERAVASARTRLDATEIGHEVGARTTLDLLDAQADLFRALRELSLAKYHVVLDRLALARAAGELNDDALRAANANLVRE